MYSSNTTEEEHDKNVEKGQSKIIQDKCVSLSEKSQKAQSLLTGVLRERIDVSTSYQILAYRSKATTCLRCFWLVHPCTHQFNKQDRATVKAQFFSRVDHIMYQTLMRRTAWLRLERWFSLVEAVVRLRLAGTGGSDGRLSPPKQPLDG